jgi:L-lactate utilization protein LutC
MINSVAQIVVNRNAMVFLRKIHLLAMDMEFAIPQTYVCVNSACGVARNATLPFVMESDRMIQLLAVEMDFVIEESVIVKMVTAGLNVQKLHVLGCHPETLAFVRIATGSV